MIPFKQTKANIIREVMADVENSYVVETADWNIATNDGLHPTPAGAQVAGEKLADALKNIFGEDFFA